LLRQITRKETTPDPGQESFWPQYADAQVWVVLPKPTISAQGDAYVSSASNF